MLINDHLRIIFRILNPINTFIPKKETQIVFYSNLGFRDNVKAVYDYMILNQLNKKYHIICSCNDYKNYKSQNIKNVKFVNTITGIFYFLTSKYFFYSFGKYPVCPTKDQVVINLWHGTPLKTIGTYNKKDKNKKQDYFTYVLAASPRFVSVMANSFGVDEKKVLLCGHARNDHLFRDTTQMKELFQTHKYQKTFIWLPTFRKQTGAVSDSDNNVTETKLSIFTSWNSLEELNIHLQKLKSLCIIKLHPLQEWTSDFACNYSNIIFFTHKAFVEKQLDLYKILAIADGLITDYSSVYFDYLLLNRPIGFTIDDLSSYSDNRGFIFSNPIEYMPGPKIKTKSEFYEFLDSCCSGKESYEKERIKINDVCNYYKDGNNSQRILKLTGVI